MFIRYNAAMKFWEMDTSTEQNGTGPWLILPVDITKAEGGGAVSKHAPTHGALGSDPLKGDVNIEPGNFRSTNVNATGIGATYFVATDAYHAESAVPTYLHRNTATDVMWRVYVHNTAGLNLRWESYNLGWGNGLAAMDLTTDGILTTRALKSLYYINADSTITAKGQITAEQGFVTPTTTSSWLQGGLYCYNHFSMMGFQIINVPNNPINLSVGNGITHVGLEGSGLADLGCQIHRIGHDSYPPRDGELLFLTNNTGVRVLLYCTAGNGGNVRHLILSQQNHKGLHHWGTILLKYVEQWGAWTLIGGDSSAPNV